MENNIKELYLFAGHSNNDSGAIGVNGRKEADETKKVRNSIRAIIEKSNCKVFVDDDRDNLTMVLLKTKSGEEDVVCDIHFNAVANPKANGVEVIIPTRHTTKEKQLAAKICKAISTCGNIKSRGVKTELDTHRGSLGIMKEKGVNILIEMCFITNPTDMANYDANYNAIVSEIAKILVAEIS
jgi:N-acetylmuramoyl-L-alanine amidase